MRMEFNPGLIAANARRFGDELAEGDDDLAFEFRLLKEQMGESYYRLVISAFSGGFFTALNEAGVPWGFDDD